MNKNIIHALKHMIIINIIVLFFSQASEHAGFLNPQIWLPNHMHVTGPAFYDTAHGPDFFPRSQNFAPKS